MEQSKVNKWPFKCDLCNSTFTKKHSILRHIESVHEGKKPFMCEVCKSQYAEKGSLIKHVLSKHENRRPHECHICRKGFIRKQHLMRHIASVHGGKNESISLTFLEQKYNSNCKLSSANQEYDAKKVETGKFNSDSPNICKICTNNFLSSINMDKHYALFHRGKENAMCSACFLTRHILETDEEKSPFICNMCDSCFSTNSLLKRHLTLVHKDIKPFNCKNCEYASRRKINLKKHMISFHGEKESFECNNCNFKSSQKIIWKKHKMFTQKKKIKNHISVTFVKSTSKEKVSI